MAGLSKDGMLYVAIFLGVIVAVVFTGQIATDVNATTTTFSPVNKTYTTAGTTNTSIDIDGRLNTTAILVQNETTDVSGNFTFLYNDSAGNLGLRMVTTDNAVAAGLDGVAVNLTYTYQPEGYLNDNSSRSVANLIPIFAALAIVVFIIVMLFKGSLGRLIGRA